MPHGYMALANSGCLCGCASDSCGLEVGAVKWVAYPLVAAT